MSSPFAVTARDKFNPLSDIEASYKLLYLSTGAFSETQSFCAHRIASTNTFVSYLLIALVFQFTSKETKKVDGHHVQKVLIFYQY